MLGVFLPCRGVGCVHTQVDVIPFSFLFLFDEIYCDPAVMFADDTMNYGSRLSRRSSAVILTPARLPLLRQLNRGCFFALAHVCV